MSLMLLYTETMEGRITYLTDWSGYENNRILLEPHDRKYGRIWMRDNRMLNKGTLKNDVVVDTLETFVKKLT